MVTTTRQLAKYPQGIQGPTRAYRESVGSPWDVYAWIVASRDVVVECAREGDGLAKSPRFGTADTDLTRT